MLESIGNFFKTIGAGFVSMYQSYSDFIHDIAPAEAGDVVVMIINVVVIVLILKALSFGAFKK